MFAWNMKIKLYFTVFLIITVSYLCNKAQSVFFPCDQQAFYNFKPIRST